MNSVRASINCSAEIPLSKASPSQRWKVSIWAFIPQTVNSSRGGHMDFAVDRAGWESGVCVLFWKGIHCAPPIRLNYRIKSRHSPASSYSSCEIIAGMVSSLRSVRISQPLSVTTIVCSYCADKLRSLVLPSSHLSWCGSLLPALTIGSMVKVIPVSARRWFHGSHSAAPAVLHGSRDQYRVHNIHERRRSLLLRQTSELPHRFRAD